MSLGIILLTTLISSLSAECDYYLAPSGHSNRVGIYAGHSYEPGENTDDMVTAIVQFSEDMDLSNRQLGYFAYKHALSNFTLIEFGVSMLFNQRSNGNMRHMSSHAFNLPQTPLQILIYQHLEAYSIFPSNYFEMTQGISLGEEMIQVPNDDWLPIAKPVFTESSDDKRHYSLDELREHGQCLSHLFIDASSIPLAGKGVFTKRTILKDSIIQVSPVLVHPKGEILKSNDGQSVLSNYFISAPGSDVAILPLGLVGICNHGGEKANARLEWFFWPGLGNETLLQPIEDILISSTPQLFLAYRAIRDIDVGEEVTIDYGRAWEQDWELYLERRSEFKMFESEIPLFRRTIDAPADLFPEHWFTKCLGKACDRTVSDEL